jgi:hypothetical protein
MIAPHRIQCDTHHLALLSFFDDDRFAALRAVPTAVPADEMSANRFSAANAVGILLGGQMLVASAFPLSGLGGTPFWYGHFSNPFCR